MKFRLSILQFINEFWLEFIEKLLCIYLPFYYLTSAMFVDKFYNILQIFKYLVSLDVEDSKDVKSGYSITFVSDLFHCWSLSSISNNWAPYDIVIIIILSMVGLLYVQNFSPNPYFEDTCLTKTYSFFDEGTTNITSTMIKWKEGMVGIFRIVLCYLFKLNASNFASYNLPSFFEECCKWCCSWKGRG